MDKILHLSNFTFKKKKIGLNNASLPIFLVHAVRKFNNIAFFADKESHIYILRKRILQIDSSIKILLFPEFDCPFFSNIGPSNEIKSERMSCLYNLLFSENNKTIFISTIKSIIYNTISKEDLFEKKININLSSKENIYDPIISFLRLNAFKKVDFVCRKGEYAVRGNILDLFSPNEEYPVRLTFDLNKVEDIRIFDPIEQSSIKKIKSYNLFPASEIFFNDKNITFFRESFRKLNIKNKGEYYKGISNKVILPGSEQFYPILNDCYDSIIKYLDNFHFFFKNNYFDLFKSSFNELIYENSILEELLESGSDFFLRPNEFSNYLNKYSFSSIFNYEVDDPESEIFSRTLLNFKVNEKSISKITSLLKDSSDDEKFIFCIESKIYNKRLKFFFNSNSIKYQDISQSCDFKRNKALIFKNRIDNSFQIQGNEYKYFFISELDIFDSVIKKETKNRISSDRLITEFSQLNLGDYIVHINHGIGKYLGLRRQIVNDIDQDFLEIEYYNNDKLLIPVENLDLISKYGQNDQKVTLDKLGLQNWQFRKASIKKKIKDIAQELAKTAAQRELERGDIIYPKTLEYEKFSSEFEFTETSDQLKSIHQVENDLSSGKPMDRLICGDVGFGKTEIAMRAAFIAFSAGYQTVMICPKLLLVNQHYNNFKKRFKKFNCVINKISRFESLKQKNEIKNRLKTGFINILIGTHALFAKDIEFNNLGLIIIDEEQSFGVEQKEKLKKLKPNSHILTLSATPIPRTLQSSLFKIKDISLIKTPPIDRVNIKTFLMFYDNNFIKKIICNEINRNGQIFYVVPKVSDLNGISKKLKKLVPKVNFAILHGKLKTSEIVRIYDEFFNRKIEILVSTAVIESGLDISNVNTIIIEKPHYFGLSQLYQLRGRVGRSSTQAYAYLILNENESLKDETIKKLEIITKINDLGSGFSIAANDLDMRGAGNIIGSEQSGHVREVGIELYYKMVNEAVDEIQNNKSIDGDWSPLINLGFSIRIPENYIKDLDLRLNIYRKVSGADDFEKLKKIFTDLQDRFGKIPESFNNFFKIIQIKILAKKLNIEKIDLGNKGCVFVFKGNKLNNFEKIINVIKNNPDRVKLKSSGKLIYFLNKENNSNRISDIRDFMNILSKK